jgi:hypothetical protein
MINAVTIDDGAIEIWSDTEVTECDGRCIGTADDFAEAKAQAIAELRADLEALEALELDDVRSMTRVAPPLTSTPVRGR